MHGFLEEHANKVSLITQSLDVNWSNYKMLKIDQCMENVPLAVEREVELQIAIQKISLFTHAMQIIK